MALSFKEKRELQKIVDAKRAELQQSDLSFKDKRAAQKALQDAFMRLKVTVDVGGENQKLADLIAGKYNDLKPLAFIGVLKEIVSEINDVEPVKEPTIKYCDANQDKMVKDAVMESALRELAGA